MHPLVVPLPTRRATTRLSRALGRALAPGSLVVLAGELGMGKTFLVRALLRSLGWPHRERVTSPTFALVHDYALEPEILHADLYRLADESELGPLGLLEGRRRGAALLVEWGRPYAHELGGDALFVTLALVAGPSGSPERTATIEGSGPRSSRMLEAISAAIRAERLA
jgi:tRNA threonylcarbamoyl adenosine modification protein YjeE